MPEKSSKSVSKSSSGGSAQQQLIESNLKLQSKLVQLIESNQEVTRSLSQASKQIEEMTRFFKEAGKYIAAENEDEKLKPLLSRISELVEQNKTIMRGLILVQKYIKSSPSNERDIFSE